MERFLTILPPERTGLTHCRVVLAGDAAERPLYGLGQVDIVGGRADRDRAVTLAPTGWKTVGAWEQHDQIVSVSLLPDSVDSLLGGVNAEPIRSATPGDEVIGRAPSGHFVRGQIVDVRLTEDSLLVDFVGTVNAYRLSDMTWLGLNRLPGKFGMMTRSVWTHPDGLV